MGYKWPGMKKMSWKDVLELHDRDELAGCYMLYPDDTEAEIEPGYRFDDIKKHYENGAFL